MSERTPTLAQVINAAITRANQDIRVAMPGKITEFDSDNQTATVKPLLNETFIGDDGEPFATELPEIYKVPVMSLAGGNYSLRLPVAVNDPCLIIFTDRALDQWQDKGSPQDPILTRRHDLNDAVCIVGLRAEPQKLSNFDTNSAELGTQDGPQVRVTSSEVQLGGNSGETVANFVALANLVTDALNQLKNAISSAPTGVQDGGATFKASLVAALSAWPPSVAATKVKAK
jgi:hypothetical protein